MGVIGIVSALTLPNLNSSTGDKEKVAKVKKIYQNLQDAFGRAEAVYGPYDTWFINDTTYEAKNKRAGERITEFMKVSKDCKQLENQGCFTSGKSKELPGTDAVEFDKGNNYKIITADGTSISIDFCGMIVDIDGPNKGAYTYGKDLFWFEITNSNIVTHGSQFAFYEIVSDLYSGGKTASTWIIRYDNADYLQFQSVSGETATCKNGNTVTESHPRCK